MLRLLARPPRPRRVAAARLGRAFGAAADGPPAPPGGRAAAAAGRAAASTSEAAAETERMVQVGGGAAEAGAELDAQSLRTLSGDGGVVPPMQLEEGGGTSDGEALVLLTTRDGFADRTIVSEVGIIVGTAVASPHVAQYVWATIRTIFGGSIPSYSRLLNECSARAAFNMLREADRAGADAVVNVRYETSITSGRLAGASMFVMCYGTGVKLDVPVTRDDPGLKDVAVTPWKKSDRH